MPPIGAAYLVEHLFEVGPVLSGGMGPAPLTHVELVAWQWDVGIRLEPWEARFLHRLSCEYIAESQKAEARDAPPPWQQEATDERRKKVVKHIRNVLRGE